MKKKQGIKNTVRNLAKAIANIMKKENNQGIEDAGFSRVVIPKQANTNPSTKYPIVSNAKEVPYYAVGLMLGYVYTAMMTPQQKRLKIPLK